MSASREVMAPDPAGDAAVEADVDLSIRQFSGAWRTMCEPSPARTIATDPGIDYVFSGLPIPFFNVALLTGTDLSQEDLASHGASACAWAARAGVPWLFVVTHERLRPGVDADAALAGAGLAMLMPLTGMIAEQVAPAPRTPEGLRLTQPRDDAGCATLLDVNGAAYAMDLAAGKPLIGRASFWAAHVPVVGIAGGKPASCAAVLMVDGYRYVALVATEPDLQRRGYGDAAMRHALQVASEAHGPTTTVLHATAAGRPIYERMGYRVIANHTVFIESRFLAEH